MKEGIHPQFYPDAQVVCSCGNSWTVGATVPTIRTDVCHACHPFFTGEQRIVDTEGQVDRFYQRLEKREEIQAALKAHQEAVASGALPVSELELGTRTNKILESEDIRTIADLIARLEEGEDTLLQIPGFGQKSLIDVKKRLRAGGYIK
jgi:large subunit ribosomal protein L31